MSNDLKEQVEQLTLIPKMIPLLRTLREQYKPFPNPHTLTNIAARYGGLRRLTEFQ